MDQRQLVHTLLENRGRLTGYAYAILRSPSETDDVFQDICLKAMESTERFETDQHLVNWAMQATRNLAIDLLRRSSRANRRLDESVLSGMELQFGALPGVDPAIDEALEHCLGKLNDVQRDLLDLRYRSDLPGGAIATRTGKSRDAVYKSLARIHEALFRCITGRIGPGPGRADHA